MYRFLGWCLKLRRGKDCRRLEGIGKSSSLEVDWRTFQCYYENVTKSKVDDDDGCEVRRVTRLDVSGLGVKHVPNRSFCRASSSWSRSTAWIHRRRRSRGIDLFESIGEFLTGS